MLDKLLQEQVDYVNNLISEYKESSMSLDSERKKAQQVQISIDTIKLHYENTAIPSYLDMVESQFNADMRALQVKADKVQQYHNELTSLKSDCFKNLKAIHNMYMKLENTLHVAQEDFVSDPFMVEVTKLLYPTLDDNLQIRADPPIAGVMKNEYRPFTTDTASNI